MLSNLKILLIGIAITASHTAKLDAPKKNRHERILRKMDKKTLKKKLTPLQYHVTQEGGTEKPFDNKYWDHKETGIYVDVVTGEALFSSQDKFDSNSGWPSFTQPIKQTSVKTKDDFKLFMKRTEVLSKDGGSHLGHVFDDGPGPSKKRYCINSAALKFIPVTKLVEEGYSEFLPLFSKSSVNKGKEFKEASHRKSVAEKTKEEAIFAGGCFWCVEAAFDKVPGVLQTISGYIGGFKKNPTYEEVIRGNTGHVEAVKLIYDPEMISYRDLLAFFWMNIGPTNKKGQFCDIGPQYVTVIFSLTPEQKKIALKSRDEHVKNLGLESLQIVTEIQDGSKLAFYKAEEYHQGYHIKNPLRYKMYYNQCGREKSLESIWKKDVREKLMNKYSGK